MPTTVATTQTANAAQHDLRTAILVEGVESRTCLSIILSFTGYYEDVHALLMLLCKKGSLFLNRDFGILVTVCVPRPPPSWESMNKSGNYLRRRSTVQSQHKSIVAKQT